MIHRNIEILPAGTNRGKPDKCRLDSADPANKPRSAQLNARNQFVLINQFCKTKQPQCLDPLEGGNYQDSGCHTRATLLWSFPMRNTGCDEKGGGTNNLEQINKFNQLRLILSFFPGLFSRWPSP